MSKSILIRQTKGTAQTNPTQKKTLKALGLRGISSTIYRKDTRALRGMLNTVRTWIEAEQVDPSKTKRVPRAKGSGKGFKLA